MSKPNRYFQMIEHLFLEHYLTGATEVSFTREEMVEIAKKLKIKLPKNLGDVIYSFRYRTALPASVNRHAPAGKAWIIRPDGKARYKFVAVELTDIVPNPHLVETKIPDATPGIITKYSGSDEQALLAMLRYNRLIDVFTGVTCYSLQNHLRTTVPNVGQVETDEVYVGLDRQGVHYVFPVQAKGGNDRLNVVQIEQDMGVCADRFPSLIARPIAAQFMTANVIALFAFERDAESVKVTLEKHYRLVSPEKITPAELEAYRSRPVGG